MEQMSASPTPPEEKIYLAAGCFWGMERILWQTMGVQSTTVGYMGGSMADPTYAAVCTGITGHAETVRVIYDPSVVSTRDLAAIFFENHDPTQHNRQGNDVGSQYRGSVWTTTSAQFHDFTAIRDIYQAQLTARGLGVIATELHAPPPPVFYPAESYHQQYLLKNPGGYCNHGFNGVACPRP